MGCASTLLLITICVISSSINIVYGVQRDFVGFPESEEEPADKAKQNSQVCHE